MSVNLPEYVGVGEPQMLAHLLILLGVVAGFRSQHHRCSLILTAGLMTTGLFVKHNAAALPLAFGAWLLITNRAAALRFIAGGLLAGTLGALACTLSFGAAFWDNLMAPRVLAPVIGLHTLLGKLSEAHPFLLLALLPLGMLSRQSDFHLVLAYIISATVLAAVGSLAYGTAANLFIDLVIAMALGIGQLFALLHPTSASPSPNRRLLVLIALPAIILLTPGFWAFKDVFTPSATIAQLRERAQVQARIVASIRAEPGPALCDTPVFCYWAGKPMVIEPFNWSQKIATGRTSDFTLAARVAAREFAIIQLFEVPSHPNPMTIATAAVRRALADNYTMQPVELLGIQLFIRR